MLKQLYYALVYPYINYGLISWGNTYTSKLQKIRTGQNKCIRNIFFANKRESATPYFNLLRILKSTSFPGLSYEDEARHEKALVWAGRVTTQKLAVFDRYSSRSGEIFFNEIYKSSKQINSQKTSQSRYYLCVERSLARIS